MSSIITSNIDETYPVAGQDNNSQGFRDNFNNIKVAIGQAKSEITALENNTAKTNATNNFNGNILYNARTYQFWGTYKNIGASGSQPVSVDLEDGDFQRVQFTNLTTNSLTFRNWPVSGNYAKVRVAVTADATAAGGAGCTITISTEGGGLVKKSMAAAGPFTISTGLETKIIEAYSVDGGATVYVDLVAEFAA